MLKKNQRLIRRGRTDQQFIGIQKEKRKLKTDLHHSTHNAQNSHNIVNSTEKVAKLPWKKISCHEVGEPPKPNLEAH